MTDATTTTGPLTQKVLEFTDMIVRTVSAAKDDREEAWASLARLVATDVFERVGIWRESMTWQDYVEFLNAFASAKGFESVVRRITETSSIVFYEIEEHHIQDGKVNIVNSMNAFEFDDAGMICRLDVYIQGKVNPSVPVQGVD
jgi:hypothetical protein